MGFYRRQLIRLLTASETQARLLYEQPIQNEQSDAKTHVEATLAHSLPGLTA